MDLLLLCDPCFIYSNQWRKLTYCHIKREFSRLREGSCCISSVFYDCLAAETCDWSSCWVIFIIASDPIEREHFDRLTEEAVQLLLSHTKFSTFSINLCSKIFCMSIFLFRNKNMCFFNYHYYSIRKINKVSITACVMLCLHCWFCNFHR